MDEIDRRAKEGKQMKYNYKISITDSAEYIIKAASQEKAMEMAIEWFEERSPKVTVEITKEKEDVEV